MKLRIEPDEQILPMLDLQAAPDVTAGDQPILCPLLLQECQQTSGQGPETQNGLCRHDLIGIATQKVLVVLKEGFHLPADSERIHELLVGEFKLCAPPVAQGRARRIQVMTGDKHQSRTKLANPTLDKMGIDLLTTRFTRPDDLLPVVTCQAGSVVGELEPFALTILRDDGA